MSEAGRAKTAPRDVERVFRFLEELGWLLRSFPDMDLHTISQATAEVTAARNLLVHSSVRTTRSENSQAIFLVGTLPNLFTDETIFPQNEDIAEFALETLHIKIPRWQKKSKYEIIGHIVCNTTLLSGRELDELVTALNLLIKNDKKARNVIRAKQESGLSWSETIQKINRER